ncbi:MAG: hypothetical protein R3F46_14540 [bacterium]
MPNGENIWLGEYPAQPQLEFVSSSADPVLLDYLLVLGQPDGGIWLRSFSGGEAWRSSRQRFSHAAARATASPWPS